MFNTKYKQFKESLSRNSKDNAKRNMLIEKIRRIQQLNDQIKESTENMSKHNIKVQEVLEKMKTHSIIVDGVLVEVYGSYKNNRFQEKAFFEEIDNSVDTLGSEVKDMVDKYKEIHQYTTSFSYTRSKANKENRPTGDYTTNESVFTNIKDFFVNLFRWSKSFFTRSEQTVNHLQSLLSSINESSSVNEAYTTEDALRANDVAGWVKNGKHKLAIIDGFIKNGVDSKLRTRDLVFRDANGKQSGATSTNEYIKLLIRFGKMKASSIGNTSWYQFELTPDFQQAVTDYAAALNNTVSTSDTTISQPDSDDELSTLNDSEFIKRWNKSDVQQHILDVITTNKQSYLREFTEGLKGRVYKLKETIESVQQLIDEGILLKLKGTYGPKNRKGFIYVLSDTGSVFIKGTESETKYNPADIVQTSKGQFDKSYLGEALSIVSDSIKEQKSKLEMEAEQEQLKNEVAELYKELNLLEIVVDDKIHTLYTQTRTYLSATEFQKSITTVENVGEDIADLLSDIVAQHIKEFDVSGSVRYFADTSDSEDGTLGAHFDHETKKVVTENLGNAISKAINWIKRSVSKLFRLRLKVEKQLETI